MSVDPDGTLTTGQPQKAVIYLRVSTAEQADRDGDPEGYSIPAQREANRRKAESIGAQVVAEFVDRGESARSADRPQLQALLKYVREQTVDYVIVHKVDRLARNRIDDVEINVALKGAGVRLISASENIDETPSGMLLHGIMSSIAEFYSRNLATEVTKGMNQKAKLGGTPSLAPIGYLNAPGLSAEGREIRTVIVDPDRGHLVRWAFEAYLTGTWTIAKITEALASRGLMSRSTPKRAGKPLGEHQVQRMLRSPYYKGEVTWHGATYPGRHPALIDTATWHRVQDVLDSKRTAEKQREHNHYLKSSVYCGDCGSRLIVTKAKNRYGSVYPYFVCIGRHQRRTACTRKAVLISTVDAAVIDHYREIQLSSDLREQMEAYLTAELADLQREGKQEQTALELRRRQVKEQQHKLLQAHYRDAVPLDLMATEQKRLSRQLVEIEQRLAALASDTSKVQANLGLALDLAQDWAAAYEAATPSQRRLLNQAFFTHLWVMDSNGVISVDGDLAEPFASLLGEIFVGELEDAFGAPGQDLPESDLASRIRAEQLRRQGSETIKPPRTHDREGLKQSHLVPPVGLEPTLNRF